MNLSRQNIQKWVIAKIKKSMGNIKFKKKQKEPLRYRFFRECMK